MVRGEVEANNVITPDVSTLGTAEPPLTVQQLEYFSWLLLSVITPPHSAGLIVIRKNEQISAFCDAANGSYRTHDAPPVIAEIPGNK